MQINAIIGPLCSRGMSAIVCSINISCLNFLHVKIGSKCQMNLTSLSQLFTDLYVGTTALFVEILEFILPFQFVKQLEQWCPIGSSLCYPCHAQESPLQTGHNFLP